jgi:hypothetical protein
MRVFFYQAATNFYEFLNDKKAPAYKKIGAFFSRGAELLKETEQIQSGAFSELFGRMGLDPRDKTATVALKILLKDLVADNVVIERTLDSGVYLISKKTEEGPSLKKFAVFKIGLKRAAMEMLIRNLALKLGLEDRMIPGMYCGISDIDIECGKNKEATVEELWNGDLKRFVKPAKDTKRTTSVVMGIVQPFLCPGESKDDLLEFILMSILAYAIGLRDGKEDGHINNIWCDVEDSMPIRVDPELSKEAMQKTASSLDLPYLEKDKRADMQLPLDKVHLIAKMVKKWDISEIAQTLKDQKIMFYDAIAEKMKLEDCRIDEGGWVVKIDELAPHEINGNLKIDPEQSSMFSQMQVDACIKRLGRLREYVLRCSNEGRQFSAKDLLFAVDRHLHTYYETISSPSIPKKAVEYFQRFGILSQLGRVSPMKVGVVITGERIAKEWPEMNV